MSQDRREEPARRHAARGRPGPRAVRTLPLGIRLVHEDDDLIVVDKPAGLLTIATDKEKHRTLYALLYDHVKAQRPPGRIFIVHRLDREASGLVVFARTPQAKRRLQDQFADHSASRVYLAFVEGRLRPDQQTVRSYLVETAARHSYATPDAHRGKLAITHVRVVRRLAEATLVELRLETGRKHQIRVQLADLGHPIVGDRRYGARPGRSPRLALHATCLSFTHPTSGARLEFRADVPVAVRRLGRLAGAPDGPPRQTTEPATRRPAGRPRR